MLTYLPFYPSPWGPGEPQPQGGLLGSPAFSSSPFSQGRRSYPAHTTWLQFDTPILFSLSLCRVFYQAQGNPRERASVTMSSDKLRGRCVHIHGKMTFSRCPWLQVHAKSNCTCTTAPVHPGHITTFRTAIAGRYPPTSQLLQLPEAS